MERVGLSRLKNYGSDDRWTWMIVCANAHPFEHILVSLQFLWCKHQGTSICLDSLHHHLCQVWNLESNSDMILDPKLYLNTYWFIGWLVPVEIREISLTWHMQLHRFLDFLYRPSAEKASHPNTDNVSTLQRSMGDPCLFVLFQFRICMSQSPAVLSDGLPNLMHWLQHYKSRPQRVTVIRFWIYNYPKMGRNQVWPAYSFQYIPPTHFQRL